MAIVRYCLLNSSTFECTSMVDWDDAVTFYPPSGTIIAGNNTGQVGWYYLAGTGTGGTWQAPSFGPEIADTITPLGIAEGGTGAATAAAARTNLGVGTADSPEFAAVNIGNASDTSLTRVSAGVAAIEGNTILTASQSATISKGFSVTPHNLGSVSSGTVTLNPANGNYQYITRTGAFTLAAPASDCAIDLLLINSTGAGALTFSGFQVGSSTGSALTTTSGNEFLISIRRINGIATYSIYALQ